MLERRSRTDMLVEVLNVLNERSPQLKTHILYKINANFNMCVTYLNELEQKGLIEKHCPETKGERFSWIITQKGLSALKLYQNFKEIMG